MLIGEGLNLKYEEVHVKKDIGSPKAHKKFLRALQKKLPGTCFPVVITGAVFRNPWFKMVIVLSRGYVGRIRNRDLLKPMKSSDWVSASPVTKTTYQARYFGALVSDAVQR